MVMEVWGLLMVKVFLHVWTMPNQIAVDAEGNLLVTTVLWAHCSQDYS